MRKWQVEKEVTLCVSNHYCSRGRITAAAPSVSLQTRDSPPPVSVCGSTCKHAPRPLSLLTVTVTVTAPNSRAPWKTPPCVRRGLPSESSRSNSASWSLTSLHRADTSTPRSAMTGSTAAGCHRVLAKWQPTPGTVQHGLKQQQKNQELEPAAVVFTPSPRLPDSAMTVGDERLCQSRDQRRRCSRWVLGLNGLFTPPAGGSGKAQWQHQLASFTD